MASGREYEENIKRIFHMSDAWPLHHARNMSVYQGRSVIVDVGRN